MLRSARDHLVRAHAHALLLEVDEAKLQGNMAVRQLRIALDGLYGLNAARQCSRKELGLV